MLKVGFSIRKFKIKYNIYRIFRYHFSSAFYPLLFHGSQESQKSPEYRCPWGSRFLRSSREFQDSRELSRVQKFWDTFWSGSQHFRVLARFWSLAQTCVRDAKITRRGFILGSGQVPTNFEILKNTRIVDNFRVFQKGQEFPSKNFGNFENPENVIFKTRFRLDQFGIFKIPENFGNPDSFQELENYRKFIRDNLIPTRLKPSRFREKRKNQEILTTVQKSSW